MREKAKQPGVTIAEKGTEIAPAPGTVSSVVLVIETKDPPEGGTLI
jgi:hypothetical protein